MASTAYMMAVVVMAAGMMLVMFGFSNMHSSVYGMQATIEAHERAFVEERASAKRMQESLGQFKNKVVMDTQNAIAKQEQRFDRLLKKLEGQFQEASARHQQAIENAEASLASSEKAREEESKELALRSSADEEAQKDLTVKLQQLQLVVDSLKMESEARMAELHPIEQRLVKLEESAATATGARGPSGGDAAREEPKEPAAHAPEVEKRGMAEAEEAAETAEAADQTAGASLDPEKESDDEMVADAGEEYTEDLRSDEAHGGGDLQGKAAAKDAEPSSDEPHGGLLLSGRSGRPATDAGSARISPPSSTSQAKADPRVKKGAAGAAAEVVTTSKFAKAFEGDFHVAWFRECGCTGIEIEAVTLLTGLVEHRGPDRVRTNYCENSCKWPADVRTLLQQIEVQDEADVWTQCPSLQRTRPWLLCVHVVHAAFVGVCGLPDSLPPRVEGSLESKSGVFRVSRSMLETDRVDRDAVARCNSEFDAVWVPTDFNIKTFSESGVEHSRLAVMPEAVEPTLFNCTPVAVPDTFTFGHKDLDRFVKDAAPSHLLPDAFAKRGEDSAVFTFLSVFKWEERKNWQALLQTFAATFPKDVTEVTLEDGRTVHVTVRLLIKTQFLSWSTDPTEDVDFFAQELPDDIRESVKERLHILQDSLPSELVPMLYRAADAFVLPTHGEGWGLPLIEAMASGLPTISTGWGGQTEFMKSENSWLLPFKLVPAMGEEHLWADPDPDQLRAAMLEVLRRTSEVRRKAQRACSDIAAHYSPHAVAAGFEALVGRLRQPST